MKDQVEHNGHKIDFIPCAGPGYYNVRISGPRVNSRAGTFDGYQGALKYAKQRIDAPAEDNDEADR